jgi:hypothetical protein
MVIKFTIFIGIILSDKKKYIARIVRYQLLGIITNPERADIKNLDYPEFKQKKPISIRSA